MGMRLAASLTTPRGASRFQHQGLCTESYFSKQGAGRRNERVLGKHPFAISATVCMGRVGRSIRISLKFTISELLKNRGKRGKSRTSTLHPKPSPPPPCSTSHFGAGILCREQLVSFTSSLVLSFGLFTQLAQKRLGDRKI